MAIGAPGAESFRDAIVELRNLHITVGIGPLMILRQELTHDAAMADSSGMSTQTRDHYVALLARCDRTRRLVTHNPEDTPLDELIQDAITVGEDEGEDLENATPRKPLGGENVHAGSRGLFPLPWALDGTNPNIPLSSKLKTIGQNGIILLGAIDAAVVTWTRLNSRLQPRWITQMESMIVLGIYQELLSFFDEFGGDGNRLHLVQVPATDEPRGEENARNRKTETSGIKS